MPSVFPFLLPNDFGTYPVDPVQDTNVQTEAEARIYEQYKKKPKIQSMVDFLAARLQGMENMLWGVATLRFLSSATGAQLDLLGRVVGQNRNGLADSDYLNCILARIFCNRSSGAIPDIYNVFAFILQGAQTMSIPVSAAGGMELVIGGATLTAPWVTIFKQFLKDSRMAGIGAVLRYLNSPPGASFSFAGPGLTPGPGKGFNVGLFSSAYYP